jgi:response regulator of citrate/malate metabolism
MIKVLIVEDDPMVADINKRYIQDFQELTAVRICNNGKDALEILNRNNIDLVILDVYMPKLTGIELLKEIRRREINTEVIMVTAEHESKNIDEVLRLGIIDYLIKPFEYNRFIEAINKFLEKYKMFNTNNKLNQGEIDKIIGNSINLNSCNIKKGLQEKTLKNVRSFMENNKNKLYTSEEIADSLGLSRVTIRRYMNYMMEIKEITSEIDYETGGRPSIKYKWNM